MACSGYKPLLQSYVDTELPGNQKRLLKDHLPGCDSCRQTVRLLRMEDDSIRGALLGGPRTFAVRPGSSRALKVALFVGILVSLSLMGLYGAYHGLSKKAMAGRDGALLDRAVLLHVEAEPLADLLQAISRSSGISLRLSESGAARSTDALPATIVLVQPIRLSAVLELLEDFYGLTPRIENETVYLD